MLRIEVTIKFLINLTCFVVVLCALHAKGQAATLQQQSPAKAQEYLHKADDLYHKYLITTNDSRTAYLEESIVLYREALGCATNDIDIKSQYFRACECHIKLFPPETALPLLTSALQKYDELLATPNLTPVQISRIELYKSLLESRCRFCEKCAKRQVKAREQMATNRSANIAAPSRPRPDEYHRLRLERFEKEYSAKPQDVKAALSLTSALIDVYATTKDPVMGERIQNIANTFIDSNHRRASFTALLGQYFVMAKNAQRGFELLRNAVKEDVADDVVSEVVLSCISCRNILIAGNQRDPSRKIFREEIEMLNPAVPLAKQVATNGLSSTKRLLLKDAIKEWPGRE